jgi:hypothetical protein
MRVAVLGLLMLLGSTRLQASEMYSLVVAAYPEIPNWSVRHLQLLHQDEEDLVGTGTHSRVQHAPNLSTAEAQAISTALLAWDGSPGTLFHRMRSFNRGELRGYFSLDLVAQAGVILITSGSSFYTQTRDQPCPSCALELSFSHQRFELSPEDAQLLGLALAEWVGGWDPPGSIVWEQTIIP